jgi:hypothetical protein
MARVTVADLSVVSQGLAVLDHRLLLRSRGILLISHDFALASVTSLAVTSRFTA